MVGVAQLVSASDCGSEGLGFESLHPPHSFFITPVQGSNRTTVNADIGMWPSGKAPDFDSGIRRFEPCHPSHDSLAQ